MLFRSFFFVASAVVSAQQIYTNSQGRSPRPHCNIPARAATAAPFSLTAGGEPPSYHFSQFSYTQSETVRIASPVTPSPLPHYGPRYDTVNHLLPNLSTTSWGNWDPTAVPTATDNANPYGQDAYSSLWKAVNLHNFTRGLYTTTVSPTPVPTSELILPPPLYFGPHECYSFPEKFILGVAGAAAQIEGAIADEGRSPAVTDLLGDIGQSLGLPTVTDNDYTTVENYYLYKQDIERLAAMGMKYYAFSIPWTRILPFSVPGSPVNSQALEHYNDLINFATEKGIQPIVTLIHFDTPALFIGNNPAALAERVYFGRVNYGFQNETFEDAFVNYGKIVMSHFADRVPIWITFNEAQFGSISGPGVDHVLKSHARLYHYYKEELHGKGRISMKMGATPGIPLLPSNSSHRAAAQHYTDLNLGTYLNPLVLGQDYPEAYKMTVQDYVPLGNQDLDYLNGTLDFVAVDAYNAASVYPIVDIATCAANNASSNTLYPNCVGSTQETVNGWNIGYHSTYTSYTTPTYLRTQLNYLWNTFKVPVMITEFGLATSSSSPTLQQLNDIRFDVQRSEYYLSYLTEVLKSIWEDGVHVMGAIMWSWIDNWEFGTFSHQFGLQYVNRTTQERTYRRSFFDAVDFVETRRMNL